LKANELQSVPCVERMKKHNLNAGVFQFATPARRAYSSECFASHVIPWKQCRHKKTPLAKAWSQDNTAFNEWPSPRASEICSFKTARRKSPRCSD